MNAIPPDLEQLIADRIRLGDLLCWHVVEECRRAFAAGYSAAQDGKSEQEAWDQSPIKARCNAVQAMLVKPIDIV